MSQPARFSDQVCLDGQFVFGCDAGQEMSRHFPELGGNIGKGFQRLQAGEGAGLVGGAAQPEQVFAGDVTGRPPSADARPAFVARQARSLRGLEFSFSLFFPARAIHLQSTHLDPVAAGVFGRMQPQIGLLEQRA